MDLTIATPEEASQTGRPSTPTHQAPPSHGDGPAEDPRLCLRFVCPDDPSRAFIAEALVRAQARGRAEARADGDPARVDPAARRVMAEIGMPLREGGSTTSVARDGAELVVVIQNRGSPRLPNVMSWTFDDPGQGEDERMRLNAFRRVRDEIKRRVDLLLLVKLGRSPGWGTKSPRSFSSMPVMTTSMASMG